MAGSYIFSSYLAVERLLRRYLPVQPSILACTVHYTCHDGVRRCETKQICCLPVDAVIMIMSPGYMQLV